MTKKIRLFLALVIFILSVSLLVWALLPASRESRVYPIPPADLELPVPGAMLDVGVI